MTRRIAERYRVGGTAEFSPFCPVRMLRNRRTGRGWFRCIRRFGDYLKSLLQATCRARERSCAYCGPRMKLCAWIARVLRKVTSRKGSPAFRGTFPHSATSMVIVILRGDPAFVRKGVRGLDVTDSPAYGWDIRVTVTGGPDSMLTSTSKEKLRGPLPSPVACGFR